MSDTGPGGPHSSTPRPSIPTAAARLRTPGTSRPPSADVLHLLAGSVGRPRQPDTSPHRRPDSALPSALRGREGQLAVLLWLHGWMYIVGRSVPCRVWMPPGCMI